MSEGQGAIAVDFLFSLHLSGLVALSRVEKEVHFAARLGDAKPFRANSSPLIVPAAKKDPALTWILLMNKHIRSSLISIL